MKFKKNNTIFIVISNTGNDRPENIFLEKCKFDFSNNSADWVYASTNGKEYGLNELVKNFNFVLLNQDKLIKEFSNVIKQINKQKKNILIYRHNGGNNNFLQEKLGGIFNMCNCVPFSHGDNVSKEVLAFMSNCSKRCANG